MKFIEKVETMDILGHLSLFTTVLQKGTPLRGRNVAG